MLVVNAQTAGNDLGGAEVRRIRTLRKYLDAANFVTTNFLITQGGDQLITESLDSLVAVGGFVASADPNARFPDERWFIDRKSSETRDSVTSSWQASLTWLVRRSLSARSSPTSASGSTAAVSAATPALITTT